MATKKAETAQGSPLTKLERIEKEGQALLAQVKLIKILTPADYARTADVRLEIKKRLDVLEEFISPIKKAQYDAWKVTCAQEKKVGGPLEQADQILVRLRTGWTAEQERIRREEEAKLRQIEEARERDRITAEATALAEAGRVEEAVELLEEPTFVPDVRVEPFVNKQEGFSERKTWYAEVVDLMVLVKAVAEGRAPIQAIEANQTFLNKQATAFRGALSIPGVAVRSKTSEAVRG